jgi:hypothetical protein
MTVDYGKKQTLSMAIPLIAISAIAACGSPPLPAPAVPKGPTSTQSFEECREQEAYGDAASCWKYFVAEYEAEKNVPAAELEYARAKSTETAKKPTCAAGTAWDGNQCKSLCSEDTGETWDSTSGLCLRRFALQCFRFFHQEDGHCVPDAQCPDGYRRASDGGCEEAPVSPFKPGERVISVFDQQDSSNKMRVKKGTKGTYWASDDKLAFVIWDSFVGLSPVYPGAATGVPQGKEQFAYWVGMDEIIKDGGSTEDTSLIPQWCGQTGSSPSYGRIRVGTMVKLGKHRPVDGNTNWGDAMEAFVGKVARVIKLPGVDAAGCPVIRVDADKEQFAWRIRDVTLAPVSRSVTPAPAGGQAAPPK